MSEKTRPQRREKGQCPPTDLRLATSLVEAAAYPTHDKFPRAPTNIKPQAQEGTPDNQLSPLEDAPVHNSTPWPYAGKILGNLFEEGKDWLLPPIYLNNKDTTSITSPKSPL